ncbi:stAR-related lipid transfer protein 9 isoform X4 [Nycticebus coucang]|uniref:stAR-related lipid transfer protein 9 isoform X4 n=1 Tax=Nycticebus coucang TaxID=9470 RepID=UPI00234D4341|nr:stAR-related lipid transfer protein 9 isoform X4 [Nycticebus coucang]
MHLRMCFLEIYNERVRDLLKQSVPKKSYSTLRVREHPEMGPYVQGLSQHVVTNYKQVIQLLEEGIANRITAATHVHEASSRSHAIFTIHYTQAILENNLPSEIASKINLVDLAGSERADPSYCKDRITEGANINKSLVTLGIVISTLAQNSQVFSSCLSLNSSASNGGDSGIPTSTSGTNSEGVLSRRQSYIPYRDSVLTWLLKDSLGGNSKTIMIATVSPAHTSYNETMSTLRYASNAKNIINKPRVNEDANVKLIRELREEIERLKAMLLSFELRSFGSLNGEKDEDLKELVFQNELKVDQMTKDWTQKWNNWQALLEHYSVDINRKKAGVVIDSSLPHLMALEDDVLSTGVVLYHLKEGTTKIGRSDSDQEQDIVLQGQWIERDHCTITSACGVVVLRPARGARCTVNGREVTDSCRLTQGAVITLGKAQKFRFSHPAEAAILRRRKQVGEVAGGSGSLEWLDLVGDVTASRLSLYPLLWKGRVSLNLDLSTMLPPVPDPTHQISEQTSSEEHLPQGASYCPRTGRLRRNGLHSSGPGKPCTAGGASARRGASAQGTCLTVSPKSVGIQEMSRVGKQLHQKVSQSLASLSQSANKLKSRSGLQTLTPTTQIRRAKGPAASYISLCSEGPKQPALHRKTMKTFRGEYKPLSASRPSKRRHKVLAARVRDIAKKSFYLPHGTPLKRQLNAGDLDTMAPLGDSSPQVFHAREKDNDSSDTDINYSVSSLSCVYAKALVEPPKLEDPQGKQWNLSEPDNSESDDSQISEDSLAEKEYQSLNGRSGASHHTNSHGHCRIRTRTSVRGFAVPSDSVLLAQVGLIEAGKEVGKDEREEPSLGSADEMPTETFWHLQDSHLPPVSQEAARSLNTINHRTGARLDATLPVSKSSSLDPQFQPHYEQSESEAEASYSEQANPLRGMQLSVESPLMSMDSWFSCDSKTNPSSPLGIVGSLCPSTDVQEFHPCDGERPGYWLNIEEQRSAGVKTVLSYSSQLPQGRTERPWGVGEEYTTSAFGASKLSIWGAQRLLQSGADGPSLGRSLPDMSQQGSSEVSHGSNVSGAPAASATSFNHGGSTQERDWATLQQKYLLELSVLEATEEFRPAFCCPEEDSGSLTQASGQGRDTILPVGPRVASSLDFNNFPIPVSKIRRVRAEKDQNSLKAKLEGPSDFFNPSEKEVSYNDTYSADLESLSSVSINAQVFPEENNIPHSVIEAHKTKQSNLEECFQGGRKPRLRTSSDEYFFQKSTCHKNVIIATKTDQPSQDCTPFRKKTVIQPGQLRPNSHYPLQEEKADWQESDREAAGRRAEDAFAFPSDAELSFHSAPWSPPQSSLQPPPLETFYVTKSRDALTETALEIPAYREAKPPSPPPREAWGVGHLLQNAYLKKNFPVLLQNQKPTIASSQRVTAERPVDTNPREVIQELGKCPGNTKEESRNSVYFFVAQNRHLPRSGGTKVWEFENQVGMLNIKHGLEALEGEESASSDHSRCGKPLLLTCESEAGWEEEQDQSIVLRQTQAHDRKRQFPSGARSDFTCRTINLGFEKDMPGETAVSLKSQSVHHRVSSPVTVAWGESPTPKWGGKNETGLLGKALHPKDCSEEFKLPRTESTYGKFQLVTCFQERNPSEHKGCGRLQEMLNPKEEPSGKKQNKRANNADEMARLIRSIMQLENDILEMESTKNKKLCAAHTPAVKKEFMIQGQKDQEKADRVLRPASPGKCLSFEDQPSSPKQTDDVICRDGKARQVEVCSSTGSHPHVREITLSLQMSRECIQERNSMSGHIHSAELAQDVCDSLGTCTAHREPTNTSLHPKRRRRKSLAKAQPLQPRPERSSENDSNLGKVLASLKGQPWGLGSPEELETVKSYQESQIAKYLSSSKQEEPTAQGGIEMAVQRGGDLQDKNKMMSLTQEFFGPSHLYLGTFFSQETIGPLPSQQDPSTAPFHQDLSNTLPLNSPNLPSSCLHASDAVDISSVDFVLDPTTLKIPKSPWVARAEPQEQSGKSRSHSPQGKVRESTLVAHAALCESVISMAPGAHHFEAPESIAARLSVSTSPQDQGGDHGITSMDLSTKEGLPSEAEVAVQKEIGANSLSRGSSQLEKRVSFSLQENNNQGTEAKQKAEEEAEAFLGPVSLPRVPHPEPRLLEPSVYASMCLAILEDIRQAKAQGKQLNDLVAGGTVFPYYETLLECSSRAAGRHQYKQMDQSVSDSTGNEGEAQGSDGASVSAEPGHLSVDKRKLQTSPLSADSFQPSPNTDADRGPWCPTQASSYAASALGERHCPGELKHFLGAYEQLICHSTSSIIIEKKEEATRTFSFVDPVDCNSLLSSAAVQGDRKITPEKGVAALSSQAPCDDSGVIMGGQSKSAPRGTTEDMSPARRASSPEHQEPRAQDTAYIVGSGNFLLTAQGEKTAQLESQTVICDAQDSASLFSKQDHIQSLEAFIGLEEGWASPQQGIVLPGAMRKVKLGAPAQQHVEWKGRIVSELTEASRACSKHPGPTSFPDQRPSPDPGAVREEGPYRCGKEILDCLLFSGSTEGNRTLSPPRREEGSRIVPSCQSWHSQPTATPACPSCSSTLLCYREGDPGKETLKSAPLTVHPPCVVPSEAYERDETRESSFREADMLLTHGPELQDLNMKVRPAENSTLEPSTMAAILSPAQGYNSPSTSDVKTSASSYSAADSSVWIPENKVAEKKATEDPKFAPFPAGMYSESLRHFQGSSIGGQDAQVSQTKAEPPATTQGPHILNLSERPTESELTVELQLGCFKNAIRCLSENTQFSTKSRDNNCLNSQAKSIACWKHVSSPQDDNLWEEEEQQRDQASDAQGKTTPPSNDGGLDGCEITEAGKEVAVAKVFSLSFEDPAAVPLEQRETPQPVAQRPDQPQHRYSIPMIAIFSGPQHSESSPRQQLPVFSSSPSLRELNLNVKPLSSIDQDIPGPEKQWYPPLKGFPSGKSVVRVSLKATDSDEKASSTVGDGTADDRPLKPITPPYPTSPTASCMPTPAFVTSWMPDALDQAQQGKPERLGVQVRPDNWGSQLGKEILHFGSNDINPYIPLWYPEGPAYIGWKQYVFGSAADVSSSQKLWDLTPSNVAPGGAVDVSCSQKPWDLTPSNVAQGGAIDVSSSQKPWDLTPSNVAQGSAVDVSCIKKPWDLTPSNVASGGAVDVSCSQKPWDLTPSNVAPGGAVDVSCSQKPWDLTPSNVAQGGAIDVSSSQKPWDLTPSNVAQGGAVDVSCIKKPWDLTPSNVAQGGAIDVSCSQKPWDLTPSNVAEWSNMGNGLEDQNSPFLSPLSTHVNTQDLASTYSSIENSQASNETQEIRRASFVLGHPPVLTRPEGAAPTSGLDRPQCKGPPVETGCLRSKSPSGEGSATGLVKEIMPLCLSETGCPKGKVRTSTFEKGTQTLGCRLRWSCTDISAQSEASAMATPELASWASMHNLSLHLSQLLHSTSELLGSLSKPSVDRKEHNTKRNTPDEAPQTLLMMDSFTQTTVDEGSQTDLISPLCYQASEAKPQETDRILKVPSSDTSTMSQEKGDVAQKREEAEETAWKMAQPPDLQEEGTHCRSQSPPTPSAPLQFQKDAIGQNLPSVSPAVSDAFLPPISQPEESSSMVVSNSSLSTSHSPGLFLNISQALGEPREQKELDSTNALLVDRASSPILTLCPSTQELGLPPGSLTPSAPPLEGHQKLDSYPDPPLGILEPLMDNYSQTIESDGCQRAEKPGGEGRSPLERSVVRSFLELRSTHSPQQSPDLQVNFIEQPPQQRELSTTTEVQSKLIPLPWPQRSQRLADSLVPEEVSPELGPLSSKGPSRWQSRSENAGESSVPPGEPQPPLDLFSSWRGLQHLSPCPISELTDNTRLQDPALSLPQACQPEGQLRPSSQMCMTPDPQHHNLRDLPVHNKFRNWHGVQDGSSGSPGMTEELGASCDLSYGEQGQSTPHPLEGQNQGPEWSQREQIPLQVGTQNLSLSMELTEAKLHRGFGESDALLQVLQSGAGEALAPDKPALSIWEELHARQKTTIENLRRERAERLQNFRRTRSLSPQKQLSLLPNRDFLTQDLDLPSRRREYLQQLRKDVVETTRSPESVSRPAHSPLDIELMLRDYQRAREEARAEIARARDRLRERAEQEKLRIRRQITSQLLREEEKLHSLANSSSLCTSSNGSLSSGMTSGYNSSPALSGQLQSPENMEHLSLADSKDTWTEDGRGLSTVRNSHLNLAWSAWKSSAYSRRASVGSYCCSPASQSSLGTCCTSYQDLAKHIVDTSMADVMAACSDNLHNLFSGQAAAGWNHQGEEQAVQLYFKVFSSTRHGFLGAGVVSQPLSHVWAAVSDPTLWPLYHKPIQTVRLYQRVTNNINLVYLVCNTTLCALKQPRDFCCVCVEAKEGPLSIVAAQSVYDTSMPRPSQKVVRGEILPSAWILQPITMEGKESTRVIYLAQVELGAPGFPPQLLSSFIKQQPLVIARLASFLGS